jgi:hypothetical protein
MSGFDVAGDLQLSEDETELLLVGGARLVEQQIRTGALNWKGYLPYDPDQGLPMTTDILGKGRDLSVVTQIFREWLAAIPGVTSVASCTVKFDPNARAISVLFAVECESGESLSSEVTFAVG